MRAGFALLSILMFPTLSFAEEATATTSLASTSSLPTIDCTYQFSKDAVTIEATVVETWAKHAAVELFTFNNAELAKQLDALKRCFTDQGWQGFNTAFQKSGNLDAIKSRELSVSATLKGNPSVQVNKDNQWKVSIPMDVVYQNKENKINQSLTVNLLITRKPTGGLGILQVIAVPQQKIGQPDNTATPVPAEKPAEKAH